MVVWYCRQSQFTIFLSVLIPGLPAVSVISHLFVFFLYFSWTALPFLAHVHQTDQPGHPSSSLLVQARKLERYSNNGLIYSSHPPINSIDIFG
jgi:hypothetical protein